MNLWECSEPGCRSTAVGVGGALGLRAIGWWFDPSTNTINNHTLLCPLHRRDQVPCSQKEPGTNLFKPCGYCAAEDEARARQALIALDVVGPEIGLRLIAFHQHLREEHGNV